MPSPKVICLLLLSTSWIAALSPAQETITDAYAGLSDEAAKAKFERTCVRQRVEQREALQASAEKLKGVLSDDKLDRDTRQTLEQVVQRLSPTSDYLLALEFMLKARGVLSERERPVVDGLITQLSEKWAYYQQCKRQYQRAVGRGLAERWPKLSLESKRCELGDYLALTDERPTWMLRQGPVEILQLVPKSVTSHITQYTAEKQELIQTAQTQLQPAIDATISQAREFSTNASLSADARDAARGIVEILEAPYARGLRGVALCQPTHEMPAELRATLQNLLREYLIQIQRVTPAHDRLVRDLTTRLESGQSNRLAQGQFVEQMAIDMHLAAITHLVQPTRVLANRSLRTNYLEDAHLLELTQSGEAWRYRVEFLIDGSQRWVDGQQIVARVRASANPRLRSRAPADGPGSVATDNTDLSSGQVFAYGLTGWKPAVVVDESALGVVIRWHGAADPIEVYVPRDQLRIEASHQ